MTTYGKDLILGDTAKLSDFEACQQYLKTIVYNKATQDTHVRNVSGVQGENGKDGKRQGKRKRVAGGTGENQLATRSYTREEWQKLSMEQREKVRALRAAKRNSVEDKRNASSMTQQTQQNGVMSQANGTDVPPQPN